jgi:hypothetical protein
MCEDRLRLALALADFVPVLVNGKAPVLKQWQLGGADIESWAKLYPFATNTGIVTRLAPALDIDILNADAADAVEALVREKVSDGVVLIRTGRAPKRLIPFRTERPFDKITVKFVGGERLEFLGDGQQYVAFGVHPDTGRAYEWRGGEPGRVHRSALPEIDGDGAQRLIDEAADLLVAKFGYRLDDRRCLRGGVNGHPVDPVVVADLTAALQAMDPVEWRGDHERWFELLMGCKFAGISLTEFTEWSTQDPDYADDADQIAIWWCSVEPKHGGAFWAALKARGIKVAPTSAVPPKTQPTRNIGARINYAVLAAFERNPTEPMLFSYGCLLSEIVRECRLKGYHADQKGLPLSGLLEGVAMRTSLRETLGREGIRETIRRAYAHVEAKGGAA